jgi:hypothetical protein
MLYIELWDTDREQTETNDNPIIKRIIKEYDYCQW